MPKYVNPCRLVNAESRITRRRLKELIDSHDRDFVKLRISQIESPLVRAEARKYLRACYVA